MTLLEKLLRQPECEHLDFKREFTGLKGDFLHDVLSLLNSPTPGESYLVFGVDDNGDVIGLNSHLKSSELNEFLAKCPVNIPFSVQVQNLETKNGKKVSIVIIPQNTGSLFALRSERYNLKRNHVYVRHGDTNTGTNDTADPFTIQKIIALADNLGMPNSQTETTRIDGDVFERFHLAVRDYEGWKSVDEFDHILKEHVTTYFYRFDMRFSIKSFDHLQDFQEPWAQDALDPRATSVRLDLFYDKQKIGNRYAATTDGARASNVYPQHRLFNNRGFTHYYFYILDSLDYDLNVLLNEGRTHFTLDRTGMKEFPVFRTTEEASAAIERDYKSGERLLLSYTQTGNSTSRYGKSFSECDSYPKFLNGVPIKSNKEE